MRPGWRLEGGFSSAFIKGQKRIYPLDGGSFVISEHRTWRPGAYETFEAAELAFSVPDEGLSELREEKYASTENGLITVDDLKALIEKYSS